ncbi:NigD-like C-terminal domain-containing protein [Corallococcus sp. Z5C101001]|uniref:hypothetical protein n=1 Tax=Corallococcus sp. Z5C101001 TaxID=2596829 RepID=UPI0011802CF4|nr:NigD-like C-terminal domain-containing protein [Corallococcus sp. Z5C101001]TSC23609.1 hypothetical protein FOF48_29080 [Corallococcus sp. Z5C101001]
MRLLVWSGIICGLLLGCAGSNAARKDEAQEPAASAEQEAPPTPVTPPEQQASSPAGEAERQEADVVLPLEITETPAPRDRLVVESQSVKGHVLTLHVRHGGGCKEHRYGLAWDGRFTQTAAGEPRAELTLLHDANNDRCKALVYKVLAFDLSTLRQEWSEKGHGDHATLHLDFNGVPDQSANFKF